MLIFTSRKSVVIFGILTRTFSIFLTQDLLLKFKSLEINSIFFEGFYKNGES